MLSIVLGHGAAPVDTALLAMAIVPPALLYARGASRRRSPSAAWRWRDAAFGGALASVGVAVAPPMERLAAGSATAHMVQHLLLVAVAAPLLAASRPAVTLLRGLPPRARAFAGRRRRDAVLRRISSVGRHALVLAAVHAAVLWAWHAPVLYEAALDRAALHALEHSTFLATAAAAWSAIVRSASGAGLLALFGLSLQSGVLAALLTFSPRPWYAAYTLGDQQLAGVLMWVPAGLVYLGAGLWLLRAWLDEGRARRPRPVLGGL